MFDRLKHMPLMNGLLRRPPFLYGAARNILATVQAMDANQREAWQNARLAEVLKVASQLKGYADAGSADTLADWPLLAKTRLLGREGEFNARSVGLLVPGATGGTTGQPMKVARSAGNIAREQAVIDHLCESVGINLRSARVAILRGDSIKPATDTDAPFWIDEGSSRRIFSAHHLSADNILHYKAAFKSFRPDVLFCYPSSLGHLLALLKEAGSFHIPCVFASSEMLPAETLAAAREILGANVIDFYGHAERVMCAYAINGEGYRFLPSYGHVELVPTEPGLAAVIATSIAAEGQVLVRYETGDLVRVASHDPQRLREIALGLRAFEGIEGRSGEYVELPDGRRVIGLNHIPRGVAGVTSLQLYRASPRQIGLYIVPAADFGSSSLEQIFANFRQKFPESIEALPILVERPVRERSGKAPLLLRAPDPSTIVLSVTHSNTHLENVA